MTAPKRIDIGPGIVDLTHRAAPRTYLGGLDLVGNVFQPGGEGFQPSGEPVFQVCNMVLRLAAQLIDFGADVGEFVGDKQAGHDQQSGIAHLTNAVGKFLDPAVDQLRQRQKVLLLAVVASHLIDAAVDRDGDFGHSALQDLFDAPDRAIQASADGAGRFLKGGMFGANGVERSAEMFVAGVRSRRAVFRGAFGDMRPGRTGSRCRALDPLYSTFDTQPCRIDPSDPAHSRTASPILIHCRPFAPANADERLGSRTIREPPPPRQLQYLAASEVAERVSLDPGEGRSNTAASKGTEEQAMRLVSDFGGLPAGPVDRSEYPLGPRDKRVDAMKTLMQRRDPGLTSDASRRAQEELPADLYENLPYYDRWLLALRRNLIERGHLDENELDRRIAELRVRADGAGQGGAAE